MLFPFERFRIRRNTRRISDDAQDRVLVIWLPDSLFDVAPLERLAKLVDAVRGLQAGEPGKLTVDVLGPLGSSMLRDMLPLKAENPPPDWDPNEKKPLSDVNMFSWSATAMDELLVNTWQSAESRSKVKKYLKWRWGLDFTNTIATDDKLNAELVDELRLRGVDLSDPEQHVVLMYEWDTFYARTLPVSFAAEVRRRLAYPDRTPEIGLKSAIKDVLASEHLDGRVAEVVPNVHAFTYLRGIDGKAPGEQTQKKPADSAGGNQASTTKDRSTNAQAEMNRAEGANQMDYMPRVALELQRMRMNSGAG